jgi:hypothetical protein
MTQLVAISTAVMLLASLALADDTAIHMEALPDTVAALSECNDPANPGPTRRPFAGGVVFTARCPGNSANYIEELIWARDAEGNGALLLSFPSPDERHGGGPSTVLSNVRWYPELAEIQEIAVDQEEEICRSEGIWRLRGMPPQAESIYWRQTRDCDGNAGWEVLVDRRTKMEAK